MRFVLIGDGYAAKYHRAAIKDLGGEILEVYDPKYEGHTPERLNKILAKQQGASVGWIVICSPSHLHREHIEMALQSGYRIIVEKPMVLPWEPIIDDDRISVVLQLRYLPNLPKKAKRVSVTMVRDETYFESWKGDARQTGGIFYNLFVHYIDLATQLGADFVGIVTRGGKQERKIDDMDILNVDMQAAYNAMYDDIVNGGGVKPKEMFYLNWLMNRYSNKNGYGRSIINVPVYIENQLT